MGFVQNQMPLCFFPMSKDMILVATKGHWYFWKIPLKAFSNSYVSLNDIFTVVGAWILKWNVTLALMASYNTLHYTGSCSLTQVLFSTLIITKESEKGNCTLLIFYKTSHPLFPNQWAHMYNNNTLDSFVIKWWK